ncbi:MAG TPA: chorismate synthase [bacterium]
MTLRFLTAGESHGPGLTVIIEGLPAGLRLSRDDINPQMARRQVGYGRSPRMKLETDQVEIVSGLMGGETIGAPVTLRIENRDVRIDEPPLTRPRPGHADLAGTMKYGFADVRRALERASARETAARVAAGAVSQTFLAEFGLTVFSHVVEIGTVGIRTRPSRWEEIPPLAEASDLRCVDEAAEVQMHAAIEAAKKAGDTLGGVFEVVALGVPPGLGSYAHWDRKLDGRLAQAVMSIHAVKGVEIGSGFEVARTPGSLAHDEIHYSAERGYYRQTNRAGGMEGGVTNGEPVVIRGAMKPLSTLMEPLLSVDLATKEPSRGAVVRSDVCAVPAAGVVGEAMVAVVLADALLEKFGGDAMSDIRTAFTAYQARIRAM